MRLDRKAPYSRNRIKRIHASFVHKKNCCLHRSKSDHGNALRVPCSPCAHRRTHLKKVFCLPHYSVALLKTQGIRPSEPRNKRLRSLSLRMTRRRYGVVRWIADRQHARKFKACHFREQLLHLRRIEVTDPRRAKPQILGFKHHVRRGNARIDLSEIFLVKRSDPCLFCLAPNDNRNGRAKDKMRRFG